MSNILEFSHLLSLFCLFSDSTGHGINFYNIDNLKNVTCEFATIESLSAIIPQLC